MTEEWRQVVGFPDYEVSNLARVRSKDRSVRYIDGRLRRYKGQAIRPGVSKRLGYPIVVLRKDKRGYVLYVHRLVWIAFKGPIPKGLEMNHKNGIKADSRLENLELVTHQQNMQHSVDTGLRKWFVIESIGMIRRNPNAA